MRTADAPALESLAGRISGDLITPAHRDYESARRVWNGMVDKRPAAIVRARGAVDVVLVVDHAR